MQKTNRGFIIAVIIMAALLAVSVGYNIRLGRGVADNQRLRDLQRESERTIIELAAERDAERSAVAELRNLNSEAAAIIANALDTVTATGQSLARANEILRQVIAALQSLDLLYRRGDGSGGGRLDTVGGG